MFKWRRKRKVLLVVVSIIAVIILAFVGILIYPSCSWFNKSGTEMEKEYLSNKSSFERLKNKTFDENYKFVFLSKKTLSEDEFEYYKWYYKKLPDFEEIVLVASKNGYYELVFKGDSDSFIRYAGSDFINSYYHFEDYYCADIILSYMLFGINPINEYFTISSKGNVLLSISEKAIDQVGKLTLSNEIKALTNSVFNGLVVKEIVCNSDLQRIGIHAFSKHKTLEDISLNNGLKEIGAKAFQGCKNLKQIVIPSSVQMIDSGAFTDTVIYCEVESKPDGWADDFAVENAKVYYANEWHYDDAGNPVPNS